MANKCRNRGGECPCVGRCEAVRAINEAIAVAEAAARTIKSDIDMMQGQIERLNTPPAKLRDGFIFDQRYEPVMYLDGDDTQFGYEDENGDWIECNEWPFEGTQTIWPDDCERHGIRVI